MDAELEMLVEQLKEGSAEERGLAAEKLFNKAAEDETARQKAAAIGVIQPLVSCTARCLFYASLCPVTCFCFYTQYVSHTECAIGQIMQYVLPILSNLVAVRYSMWLLNRTGEPSVASILLAQHGPGMYLQLKVVLPPVSSMIGVDWLDR